MVTNDVKREKRAKGLDEEGRKEKFEERRKRQIVRKRRNGKEI